MPQLQEKDLYTLIGAQVARCYLLEQACAELEARVKELTPPEPEAAKGNSKVTPFKP